MCGHKYVAKDCFPLRLVLIAEHTTIDDDGTLQMSEAADGVSACYSGELNDQEEKYLQLLKVLYHLNKLTEIRVQEAHRTLNTTFAKHKEVIDQEDRHPKKRLRQAGFEILTGQGTIQPVTAVERSGDYICEQDCMALKYNGQPPSM